MSAEIVRSALAAADPELLRLLDALRARFNVKLLGLRVLQGQEWRGLGKFLAKP